MRKTYIYSALFLAIGILLQAYLYFKFNYIFGYFNTFGGGRIAFGFLWLDYSFLALFLVSAVPLVFDKDVNYKYKWVIASVLVSASLVTSARTGIVAIFLCYTIYILLNLHKILKKKKSYVYIFSFFVIATIIVFLQSNVNLMNRKISASGSGRVEGYVDALSFFFNNLALGAKFDHELYVSTIGTLPHNLFIYIAAIGGLIFLLLIITWLIFVIFDVYKTKKTSLLLSFCICVLGMQFIPSVFSAYFFAILVSLVLLGQPKNLVSLDLSTRLLKH